MGILAKVMEDGGGKKFVQTSSPFLTLVTCEWNPKFATRREEVDYEIENKPYIEARAELGLEENVETYAEPGEDENIVRTFMNQMPNLPKVCPAGGGGGRSCVIRNPSGINPDPNESPREEPDAERRLIFITDLDRWSIYALIGTASYYQAFVLRDALYKHLAFENLIEVTFPPAGLAMFQLAFHLPYYAWRTSQSACEDHRQDANASPLRQSLDISLLNPKSSKSSNFLYEAQISCVVAGSDEYRWVAYCFVDTYFDIGEANETVQSYHEDSLADEGMFTDPFTFGERDADDPIQKPREYFLEVFRVRIDQVKCEWEQVVANVQENIRKYVPIEQTHHHSLALSRERTSSKVAEDHDSNVRRSRDWVVQVRRLSKQLSQDISKTVDACERFCCKYPIYFRNLPGSPDVHLSLAAIQTTFDRLELLKKTLESLAERCDDFARDLELHLIVENIEVGNLQHKLSEDNKGLSVIMMS
ncbi:hypothetical protein F5882DRAFT_385800 [Hyaloscypha sp. PMI_1271]|nr:hypothetical protein F5882DRAFT_385800 [Hyaloscypha sp. PMI_1271]